MERTPSVKLVPKRVKNEHPVLAVSESRRRSKAPARALRHTTAICRGLRETPKRTPCGRRRIQVFASTREAGWKRPPPAQRRERNPLPQAGRRSQPAQRRKRNRVPASMMCTSDADRDSKTSRQGPSPDPQRLRWHGSVTAPRARGASLPAPQLQPLRVCHSSASTGSLSTPIPCM